MLNVQELYLSTGLELKFKSSSNGGEYAGPCPYCGGKDRFLVWPLQNDGQGSFYCRQCEKKGDSVQYLIEFENMDFKDAYKAVHGQNRYEENERKVKPYKNEEKPKNTIKSKEEQQSEKTNLTEEVEFDKWNERATKFLNHSCQQLNEHEDKIAYLSARGLNYVDAKAYQIGYFPGENGKDCAHRARTAWGLKNKEATGKEKAKTKIWLPRGIIIPTFKNDKVVRLRIRREDKDRERFCKEMKYYVLPGSDMTPLFLPAAFNILPKNFMAIIVEGELDAYMLHAKVGDFCAVLGIMTAKISTLPQEIMNFLKSCQLILVATDVGDESRAGYEGWLKWKDTFYQAKRWVAVDAKDPGEMAEKGMNIRSWVMAALPSEYAKKIIEHDEKVIF